MQALLAQYPGMKWHQWDAVNHDNVREGGRMAFGSYVHTHYDFTKANVVVSLGSDFLGTGAGVASTATQGKVRGQGIGAVKFDFGNGLSSFVQADIRGGSNYSGYGGRAGVRYVW